MTISRGSLSFPTYLHGLISEVVTIALVLDISASKSWIKHSMSQDCIFLNLMAAMSRKDACWCFFFFF